MLRPDGQVHVLDFGQPHKLYTEIVSPLIRRLEEAADHVQGLLPAMMRGAARVRQIPLWCPMVQSAPIKIGDFT